MLISRLILYPVLLCALTASHATEAPVLHVYNWSDYFAPDTLTRFESETGVKVVYDAYDSNEVLEAKLLAGSSGYDLVFPTDKPFAQRHIKSGLYRELDKSKLKNYGNLDPDILAALEREVDPGNAHVVPYMWGTTGIGYNVDKVRAALGDQAPLDSWQLIFDPAIAAKLAGCGITVLDDEIEAMAAGLLYLGKDPNSTDPADFEAVAALFKEIRPYIKYFHSSQYLNDLANGDICVAHGYSGDVLQARNRAQEAGNQVRVAYLVPKEGALLAMDVMAIPVDAPHPDNAHRFIDYLLAPPVIAEISNYVAFANANRAATPLLDESLRNDPGVYPPPAVRARLASARLLPPNVQRTKVRVWTRIKTGQ